jgi:hypothetical protein
MLLMPALTMLLVLISLSHAWGPTSPAIIGSAVAAAVLLWTFIRQERRAPAPLIDLDLFRIPAFASGILAIVLSYAMLYGILLSDVLRIGARIPSLATDGGPPARYHPGNARHCGAVQRCASRAAGRADGFA